MTNQITDTQIEYLRAIAQLTMDSGGLPPSIADIAEFTGKTSNAPYEAMVRLERRGLITRQESISRSVQLTARGAVFVVKSDNDYIKAVTFICVMDQRYATAEGVAGHLRVKVNHARTALNRLVGGGELVKRGDGYAVPESSKIE